MSNGSRGTPAWQRWLGAVLLLVSVVSGCQKEAPPPPADEKTLEQEGERLRKEFERERTNK